MEAYKQYLCQSFGEKCVSEDDIYSYIKDNSRYQYNLNEKDKLHSNYTGSYYEPAITYTYLDTICMWWIFDGKIIDCIHPLRISVCGGELLNIKYYSSERIQLRQPISITYDNKKCLIEMYNRYFEHITNKAINILDNYNGYGKVINQIITYDESLFTPEFYPLCDPIDMPSEFKFKFAE